MDTEYQKRLGRAVGRLQNVTPSQHKAIAAMKYIPR